MVADHHEVLKIIHALHRCLSREKKSRRLAANVDKRAALLVLHNLTNNDIADLLETCEIPA